VIGALSMYFSRFIPVGMVTFLGGLVLLGVAGMVLPISVSAGERTYSEDFERPDSLLVGNGWREILSGGDCVAVDQAMSSVQNTRLFFDEGQEKDAKGKLRNNPLQREIEQEVIDSRHENIKSTIPSEATAELQEGQLFLHFQENQASQMVQRDIDKRVTRLSFDYTPLYAMGGVDDRAWLGLRLFFLDHKDRILGEIRHFYFNVIFEEFETSDTIYSIGSQGPFDGSMRHAEIDADQILRQHLTGVNPERVAKTRISIEISSNICGSTVEGYVDNVVSVLADATGLHRFNRAEILAIMHAGAELFKSNREEFPGNWIDSIAATYGRRKLATWLGEIPRDVASSPAALAKLMGDLYSLDGKNAFVVSYGVSILLYHF
jgi:hypothetical protein